MHNYPLATAGTIFALVAVMHLLRVLYKVDANIGGKSIPMWVSIIGIIVPVCLSIWMFSSMY